MKDKIMSIVYYIKWLFGSKKPSPVWAAEIHELMTGITDDLIKLSHLAADETYRKWKNGAYELPDDWETVYADEIAELEAAGKMKPPFRFGDPSTY